MISFVQFFLENADVITLSQIPSKDLGMFNSMVRLPMSSPYGFWMDKHGNYRPVKGVGDHETVSKDILKRAGIDIGPRSFYDFLLYAGWIRIVISRGSIFWETDPGGRPNNIQKRNMDFMKDFYDLKTVEMG